MPRKKISLPKITINKTDKNTEPLIFFKISEIFRQNLKFLSFSEIAIYIFMAGETTGKHVDTALFSVSGIAEHMGCKRCTVLSAIKSLERKGWIALSGNGPRQKKYYRLVVVNSISDLNGQVQTAQKSGRYKLPKNRAFNAQKTGSLYRPYLILLKDKKTTTEKNALSFSPPCKNLLKIFPPELQKKPILKLIQNSLAGDKMPKRNFDFIKTEIRWLIDYRKTHEVKSIGGLFRTALSEGYGRDAKKLQESTPKKKSPSVSIDQKRLDRQNKIDMECRDRSEAVKNLIDSMPQIERDLLADRARDSLNPMEKMLFEVRGNKKTLLRKMIFLYEKEKNFKLAL